MSLPGLQLLAPFLILHFLHFMTLSKESSLLSTDTITFLYKLGKECSEMRQAEIIKDWHWFISNFSLLFNFNIYYIKRWICACSDEHQNSIVISFCVSLICIKIWAANLEQLCPNDYKWQDQHVWSEQRMQEEDNLSF